MRMRRKKNLEERLAACGDYIVYLDRENKDFTAKEETNFIDFPQLFGNNNPVEMEIGCGKGGFAIEIAKQNPDTNFLAVEKSSNVIVEASEKAFEENVPNLRFARGGAEYLDCFVKPDTINKIYLNFSCPFPAGSYENRRLTYKNFLNIYKKILTPCGVVCQKTDNEEFFDYSLKSFSENGFEVTSVIRDLHNSDFSGNVQTEYEKMFAQKGLPIYRLEAKLK